MTTERMNADSDQKQNSNGDSMAVDSAAASTQTRAGGAAQRPLMLPLKVDTENVPQHNHHRRVSSNQSTTSGRSPHRSSQTSGTHTRAQEDEPHCISPMSTKSTRTMDSQREYYMQHQTILIFDWDDTLCPSTYCRTELSDELICRIWRDTCNMNKKQKEAEEAATEDELLPETTAEKLNKGDMAMKDNGSSESTQQQQGILTPSSKSAASAAKKKRKRQAFSEEKPQEITVDNSEDGTYSLHDPDESLQEMYVDKPARQALSQISDALLELLDMAQNAGKVVIVTNAETGWIELSCRAWLPRAYKEVMKCELVSARSKYEPEGVSSPAGWKARAFRDVVSEFYTDFRSWKNIISIGDAPHEREAIFRITADNAHPKCRTKSIKLMVKPGPHELLHQLNILNLHLEKIVTLDNGLDLEFDKGQGTFV